LLVASSGALACTFCDGSVCTSSLVVIMKEPGGDTLRAGTYEVELEAGDYSGSATCEVGPMGTSIDCEGLEYTLYAPLYGSPDAPHETLEIHIEDDDPPTHVEILVSHQGNVIADLAFDPRYQLADPGCDDDCFRAKRELLFSR
jgi:hypothetical protein